MTAVDCEFTVEGSGPPLILIHGIGAARDVWRFLVPQLTPHFTVVTYDLRGHGASPMPSEPMPSEPMPSEEITLDHLVEDLERVRERAGFKAAHFAGHSLGGMIGPAYARAHPDRVLSLGLLSTAAGRTDDDSVKVWGVVRAMEEQGIAPVLETLTDRWFTDAFMANHGDIVRRRLDQVIACDAEIFLNVFRIYAGTEMMPWLPEIAAPCLVLTGENDGGCNPRLNEGIAAALQNAELVILALVKHAILLEAPDEVAAHLIRFISARN